MTIKAKPKHWNCEGDNDNDNDNDDMNKNEKTGIYFPRSSQFQSRLAVGSSDRCALWWLREDVRWTDRHPTGAGPNMCRGWKGTRLLRGRQWGPAHARWRRIPTVLPAGGGFLRGQTLRLGKSARCLHRYTLLPGLDTRHHGAIVLKMQELVGSIGILRYNFCRHEFVLSKYCLL